MQRATGDRVMRSSTATRRPRRRAASDNKASTHGVPGLTCYHPRVELLEDRTLLSSLSNALNFDNLSAPLNSEPVGEIRNVLKAAADLPFIGKDLSTLSQIVQPVLDVADNLKEHVNDIRSAIASGSAIPVIAVDGFSLTTT